MVAAITLTPDNDIVGATITIDGTGFTASEDITLTYGGSPLTPVAPISTDGSGVFSGTFIVPASVQGVHSVVATDETLLTDDADFTVNSNLVITEANITVGGTINFTGTGFDGASLMSFTFGGVAATPVEDPITTNATGGFSGSLVIPAVVNGSKTLVATDAGTNTDSDTVIIDALLTITEANIIVGGTINFIGSGFSASEAITFTWNSNPATPVEDPISSDADGSFSGSFVIPATPNGSTTFDATDVTLVTDADTVIVDAKITLDVSAGDYGDSVTVTGTGFDASSATTITFNAVDVTGAALTTDADGGFSRAISVPDAPFGARTVTATDAGAKTDSDTFTVAALITLDDGSGSIGETVVISGHGFAASSLTTFTFGGSAIVPTDAPITTASNGSFSASIVVPSGFDDTVSIVATDAATRTDSITFIIVTVSSTEVSANSTFSHLNGRDLRLNFVDNITGIERGCVVDIPFGADDVYTTGGVLIDFTKIQKFSIVYLCKITHNPVGLVCSFIPGANNSASLGKIKFWGTDGNELADNSSAISSKTLRVYIRGK